MRKEAKRAEFGRIYAVDTTAKKAKAACQAYALEALSGTYDPYYLHGGRGQDWLAWRDPAYGWVYARLGADKVGTLHSDHMDGWSRDNCIRRMRYHACQTAYQPWQSTKERDAALALAHEDDHADMLHWTRWQDRYAAGKRRGLTDHECRQFADTEEDVRHAV
jgi:hypothetical protein